MRLRVALTEVVQIAATGQIVPVTLPWYANSNMALAQSKITAQGQISVPAEIRRRLGLGPGSLLEWDQEGSKIVVRRVGGHTSEDLHRALFKKPPRPRTLAELREGVRRYVRRRHASR
jgi:antitoxin PrlF